MSHDLYQQPTLIAPTEKYKQLVYESTTELVQSSQCMLSTLDRRSMGLSKCASYDAALCDASFMQQLSSSSALGYLRAASIYSEQGKQHHVIGVCNQALSVVDSNDPGYGTLLQVRMDAQHCVNKRTDFITQLPVDIVHTTLIPMIMKDNILDACQPCPFLYVSHLWRNHVIQCIDGFEFVIREVQEEDTHSQLIQFAQHTKSLYIDKYSRGTWLGDLLRDHEFCSLQKLIIYCKLCTFLQHHLLTMFIPAFTCDDIDHFVPSLRYVSNTLTQLNLLLECDYDLSLSTILLTCPNLTWINMSLLRDLDVSNVPVTTCPTLTHLVIHGAPDGITSDEAVEIWRHFPALKELELDLCIDIQSSLVATDYLPSMKVIGVEISEVSLELTYQKQVSESDEIGIARLCLLFDSLENDPSVSINQILRKHCNTLQQLYLKMDLNNDDTYDVHYPQLKKLVLQSSALWIPSNTPMLEELSISSDAIRARPAILDTIPSNLKTLEIRLWYVPFRIVQAPLEMYLDRLVQHYQLKDLIIHFNSSDSIGTVLDNICHLGQLRSLVIYVWKKWNCNQMEEFFNKLVIGCSQLRVLWINCDNAPSTRAISTLKQLVHLQQLAFSINGIDNNCHFWSQVETFPQLKHIYIYFAERASNTWVNYLKRQRPDIKISKDRLQMCYYPLPS